MITWPIVPTVATGDRMTSTQLALLADGFNERLRSGLADGPWRIAFYMLSVFRSIRYPDGDLVPPDSEFFWAYQMLKPESASWPVTGPGEAQGINTAGQIGQLVFGNGSSITPEDERLAGMPMEVDESLTTTAKQNWELGKSQRGAYDPDTGALGSPSFTAARSHFAIGFSPMSPHGNSYGGFSPLPVNLGDCADGTTDTAPTVDYEIKFTNLKDSSVITYHGTCPDTDGDVAFIARTSFAYYVYLVGGGLDVYDVKDWIEGPYSGGAALRKASNGAIQRILNRFIGEFNGTESQRAAAGWLAKAFDIQRFLASQYHLAPAKGHSYGDEIGADYPVFEFSGATSFSDGDFAVVDGGDAHTIADSFVFASALVETSGLRNAVTLELIDADDAVTQTLTIEPESATHAEIFAFETPTRAGVVKLRLKGAMGIDAGGYVRVEFAELWEYKPEVHDLYLCLRLASATLSGTLDGSGTEEDQSKEIGDNYFANCCIQNVHGAAGLPGSPDAINGNAIYDTARRLSQIVRFIPRHNFIGYEVDTSGRSVCYFTRYAYGLGADSPVDLFDGIADAIAHTAPDQGWSNEWLMGATFKAYHPSDSSEWKTDGYTDVVTPLSNRCAFYHPFTVDAYPDDLIRHFSYGYKVGTSPESPSGANYWHGINQNASCRYASEDSTYRQNFYKSCRVYEPDPEIESAETLDEGGTQIVKITFKTRFHHCDTAPDTIARELPDYSDTAGIASLIADLAAEPYRSTENALREYICNQNYGSNCTKGGGQPGNAARCTELYTNPDDPYGTCFPSFYFIKLVEKPYDDGNDKQNGADTPLTADQFALMELRLRAMSEGYVDGTTTLANACSAQVIYDYTFENLCYDAFGGRWLNTLPTKETDRIDASNIRSDAPQGFGPLPNTICSSEIFNQFAKCINKLDKVRVALPMQFQCESVTGYTDKAVSGDWQGLAGSIPTCSTSAVYKTYSQSLPDDPTATTHGGYSDCTAGFTARTVAGISGTACLGASFDLHCDREDKDYYYTLLDPDALEAIPETWRDMLDTHGKLVASITTSTTTIGVTTTTDAAEASKCCLVSEAGVCPSYVWENVDGSFLKFVQHDEDVTVCGFLDSTGTIRADSVGMNVFPIQMRADGGGGYTDCNTACGNTVTVVPVVPSDSKFIQIPLA